MSKSTNFDTVFKVCLVGPESAGKTAIICRYLHNEFHQEVDSTIEDSHSTIFNFDLNHAYIPSNTIKHKLENPTFQRQRNTRIKLDILDTGGSTDFSHLHEKWFGWADGIVLVFNIEAHYTFEMLPYFLDSIKKHRQTPHSLSLPLWTGGTQCFSTLPLLVVGSHSESEKRQVTQEEALEFAFNNGAEYIEVSAKTGNNVENVFSTLIKDWLFKKQQLSLLAGFDFLDKSKNETGKKKPKKDSKGLRPSKSFDDTTVEDEEHDIKTESSLSIVKDADRRKQLCESIPLLKVTRCKSKAPTVIVRGPMNVTAASQPTADIFQGNQQFFSDFVAAQSVSTYPKKENGKREGDPMCDQYCLSIFENRTIMAIGDGCNWGDEVRMAAYKASSAFVSYMARVQKDITNTREAAILMLRAFNFCHHSIVEGANDEIIYSIGTTTLLGGMAFELEEQTEGEWAVLCISLGDCKAYRWNASTKDISDITLGNRINITDARDPGGRLGPYVDGASADLRNLSLYLTICKTGDYIIFSSDGVGDNFDPQHMGVEPATLKDLTGINNWTDLETTKDQLLYAKAELAKQKFAFDYMNSLISANGSLTALSISQKLVEHCINLTKSSRDFMESNPDKKLPHDYKLYPGKMDHTTCCVVALGSRAPIQNAKSLPNAQLWVECSSDDGEKFWFNISTKESCWYDPFIDMGPCWKAYYTDDDQLYYHNSLTGETSWEPPTAVS